MAILKLLHYPDKRLRTVAEPVNQVDSKIQALVDDMFETMYEAPGIGLAATQADIHKRVITIDVSEGKDHPLTFINPQITHAEGSIKLDEGCLSVPGIYELVPRAEFIRVKALNRDGEAFELEADDLLAVCIQHEIDHLDGKLFVDYLSGMKRQRIQKRMEKLKTRM